MALGKDFKVKDTINVGVSGLFGSGIRIGDGSTYPAPYPAIDAWGPILSGGRDLSLFLGDAVDSIRETVLGDGEITSDKQGTFQYQVQEDANAFDPQTGGFTGNDVYTTVEVLGLQGYDSPVFTNLALSGVGTGSTTATISGADTIVIDPGGYGNTDLGIDGAVRIKGNLFVDGETTTINSTSVSLSDSIVQLGYGENEFLDDDTKVPSTGVGIKAGDIANATILYRGADGWEVNGNSLTSLVDFHVGDTANYFTVDAGTGNVTTEGTLAVNGTTTLSGALFVKTDNDGTTKFTVAQDTGNTDIEGTLNVAGLATFETTEDSVAISSLGTVALSGDLRVDDYNSADTNYFLVDNSSGETTIASATISDLTDNRIVIAGTNGIIEDDANFTFNGTTFQIKSDGTGFSADTSGNVNANGTTSLSGALYVKTDGADSVTTFSVAQDTGDVMTQGDLDVNGTTTLSGDLALKTDAGIEQFSVQQSTGNVSISGTTDIKGATNIDSTLQTNDAITIREAIGTTTPKTVEDVFSGSNVTGNVVAVTCGDSSADSIKFIVVAQETDDQGVATGGRSTAELLTLTTTNYTDINNDTAAATGGIIGTHYAQVDNNEVAPLITDIEADASGNDIVLTVTCKPGSFAKVTVFSTSQYL